MDPNEHKRIGYVTSLGGLGLSTQFAKDLLVSVPFTSPTFTGLQYKSGLANVVGVIETFSWNGGSGDPIKLDFWVSQQNATQIKAAQQATLTSTAVNALGWWIIDYDQETKQWYEQSYPMSRATITGVIHGRSNPALDVDLTPTPAKDGIDVNVYKISMSVAPAANMSYALVFANAANKRVVKTWGLVVGSLAS